MHDRVLHGDMTPDGDMIESHPWDELCPRCTAVLTWRHQSVQCPDCTWKEGCCGGGS